MDLQKAREATYFLLRVVAGFLIFQSGCVIVLGWFGGMPNMPPGATMPLNTQMGFGGLLQLAGGILLILGLLTRPAAFLLSGEMAVAYWQFHAPNGTWPLQNGGVPAALFCFLYLYIAAEGGGAWSLDALLRRRRKPGAGA